MRPAWQIAQTYRRSAIAFPVTSRAFSIHVTNDEYAGTAEEDPYLSDDSVDPDDMSYEVAI